jgi:hypothetical protein
VLAGELVPAGELVLAGELVPLLLFKGLDASLSSSFAIVSGEARGIGDVVSALAR